MGNFSLENANYSYFGTYYAVRPDGMTKSAQTPVARPETNLFNIQLSGLSLADRCQIGWVDFSCELTGTLKLDADRFKEETGVELPNDQLTVDLPIGKVGESHLVTGRSGKQLEFQTAGELIEAGGLPTQTVQWLARLANKPRQVASNPGIFEGAITYEWQIPDHPSRYEELMNLLPPPNELAERAIEFHDTNHLGGR